MTKVFHSAMKPAAPNTQITFHAAKNEFECAQTVLKNSVAFTIDTVLFTPLTDGKGNQISDSQMEYHFLEYYKGYADPLSNNDNISVAADSAQAVWMIIHAPKSVTPGKYIGQATIRTSLGDFTVPLTAIIYNVTIPDPQSASLTLTNWIGGSGFSSSDSYDNPLKYYGITKYTPEWWALMDKWAKSFTSHRQNMMLIRTQTLLKDAPGILIDGNYNITFDWSLFDQYVQFFLDRGITRLEGQPLAVHCTTDINGNRVSDFNKCGIYRFYKNSSSKLVEIWDGNLAGMENTKWNNQYLTALNNHLIEKGWKNIWIQHAFDEPNGVQGQLDWNRIADTIHRYMPDIKIIDALHDPKLSMNYLAGHINTWVLEETQFDLTFCNTRKAAGDEVWMYTTASTLDPWLNRLASQDLSKGRLMYWLLYKWKLSAFLHWGWNAWQHGFYQGTAYAGDANIVYPDSLNKTVKGSVRYENMRDGAEDYELFNLAEKIDSTRARLIVDGVITNGTTYQNDESLIRANRLTLLNIAAGAADLATFRGRWLLDENGGTTVSDEAGNGYNATLQGGTAWTSGKVGSALSFDGIDDYAHIEDSVFKTVTGSFTVAFWAQPVSTRSVTTESNTGTPGTAGQRYALFPTNGSVFGTGQAGMGISVGTNGVSVFEHASGYLPSTLVYSGTLSGWTHIAVVYLNNQPTLYVNGTAVRTGVRSAKMVHASLTIGGGSYGWYKGSLDDISIYPFAMRSGDVSRLMGSTTTSERVLAVAATGSEIEISPNPFNPSTKIAYDIPNANHGQIAIYDCRGYLIKSFPAKKSSSGLQGSIVWDGCDVDMHPTAAGVYCILLTADNRITKSYRLILVK
ncbi:MAG: DUF4091 domain-containing protein [Fibrobacteres bacterium]|nr:DUF4091 domain-containing protein [Fibrobacterota bacterium]